MINCWPCVRWWYSDEWLIDLIEYDQSRELFNSLSDVFRQLSLTAAAPIFRGMLADHGPCPFSPWRMWQTWLLFHFLCPFLFEKIAAGRWSRMRRTIERPKKRDWRWMVKKWSADEHFCCSVLLCIPAVEKWPLSDPQVTIRLGGLLHLTLGGALQRHQIGLGWGSLEDDARRRYFVVHPCLFGMESTRDGPELYAPLFCTKPWHSFLHQTMAPSFCTKPWHPFFAPNHGTPFCTKLYALPCYWIIDWMIDVRCLPLFSPFFSEKPFYLWS